MLIAQISEMARSNEVFYLHPSFGYYYEVFHAEPHGLAYELKAYRPGELLPPELSAETLAQNEAFHLKQADTTL